MGKDEGQLMRVCPYCHTVNRLNPGKLHQAVCGMCKNRLDATYYDILGVTRSASFQDMKQRYRYLAKMWHPDRNPGSRYALELFKSINDAYRVLSNPKERHVYDETLDLREIPQIEEECSKPESPQQDKSIDEIDELEFQWNLMLVLLVVCILFIAFIAWFVLSHTS